MRIPVRWFTRVCRDLSVLPEALDYYMDRLAEAQAEVAITGNFQRCNLAQPGLIAFYDAMHTDLDSITDHLESRARVTRARSLRDHADNPKTNVTLKATELKILVELDDRVIQCEDLCSQSRYVLRLYRSLGKTLDQRGYTLKNVTALRVAGLEEIEV